MYVRLQVNWTALCYVLAKHTVHSRLPTFTRGSAGMRAVGRSEIFEADGFLYLVDRKKDMIDSGGIKICQ